MKISIPLATLAIDETNPQTGDPVDVTATGKIASIEGDMAVVEIETVNGSPVPAGDAIGAAEPDEDDLRRQAEEADKLPFGQP